LTAILQLKKQSLRIKGLPGVLCIRKQQQGEFSPLIYFVELDSESGLLPPTTLTPPPEQNVVIVRGLQQASLATARRCSALVPEQAQG